MNVTAAIGQNLKGRKSFIEIIEKEFCQEVQLGSSFSMIKVPLISQTLST